jgi:hypothetical protein
VLGRPRRSLERLAAERQGLYHWSDISRTTDLDSVVGVAAWLPAAYRDTKEQAEAELRKNLSKTTKMLTGCHVVYVGASFWERPEADVSVEY